MDCLTPVFQDETPEHHTVAAEAGRITEEAVRFLFGFASKFRLFTFTFFLPTICACVCVPVNTRESFVPSAG